MIVRTFKIRRGTLEVHRDEQINHIAVTVELNGNPVTSRNKAFRYLDEEGDREWLNQYLNEAQSYNDTHYSSQLLHS